MGKVSGGWRMYFEREDPPGERNIYSDFSTDGLTWTEDASYILRCHR